MATRLSRILGRLGIRPYPSWPAMPSNLLVIFLTLSSLLNALITLFFAIVHPDLVALGGVLNGRALWAMSWWDTLRLCIIVAYLLAFGALWLWTAVVAAVCFKILVDRQTGSPPPAAAA